MKAWSRGAAFVLIAAMILTFFGGISVPVLADAGGTSETGVASDAGVTAEAGVTADADVTADESGTADAGATAETDAYTTHAFYNFDNPATDDAGNLKLPGKVIPSGETKWEYEACGIDGKSGGYKNAVKIATAKDTTTYPKLRVQLDSVISSNEAGRYAEIEFDLKHSALSDDNAKFWLTSEENPSDSSEAAIFLNMKANGQINIRNAKESGNPTAHNITPVSFSQNPADAMHHIKLVIHTGTMTDKDGTAHNGWLLDRVEFDGTVNSKNAGAYVGSGDCGWLVLQEKSTTGAETLTFDNISVVTYQKAAASDPSPVPDRAAYRRKVWEYADTVSKYDSETLTYAYEKALDQSYAAGVTQTELDAQIHALEIACLSVRAKEIVSYQYETDAAAKNATLWGQRYRFDDTTFRDNFAYEGVLYWNAEKDGEKGKNHRVKFPAVEFASLPPNSYIETSFDFQYNLNGHTELVFNLWNGDTPEQAIARMGITAKRMYAKDDNKSETASSENEMHRIRIIHHVKDADGNAVNSVRFYVDGVPNGIAPVVSANQAACTKYNSFEIDMRVNSADTPYPELWMDNFSIATYVSESGEPLTADKTRLVKKMTQLSQMYQKHVSATEIERVKESLLTVLKDATATSAEVAAAEESADAIIFAAAKAEFAEKFCAGLDSDGITADIDGMGDNFVSERAGAIFDVTWSSSNDGILSHTGAVTRGKLNKTVKLTALLSAAELGQSFTSEFDLRVLGEGNVVSLPASGQILTYQSVAAEEEMQVPVSLNGTVLQSVTVPAGGAEVQLFVDTDKHKYAIAVSGAVATGETSAASDVILTGETSADKVTSVAFGATAPAAALKAEDTSLYRIQGLKFMLNGFEREELLYGSAISAVRIMDRNLFREPAQLVVKTVEGGQEILADVQTIDLADAELGMQFDALNEIPVSLKTPEELDGARINAYVFDSFANMYPIAPKYEYLNEAVGQKGATIYIAGDSTAQTYRHTGENNSYPQTGWGQVLAEYLSDGIAVENRALGGASAKSFYNRIDNTRSFGAIKKVIRPGDYLLIQFGHNDQLKKGETDEDSEVHSSIPKYKEYLKKYVDEAKALGATPIILTSIIGRTSFGTTGPLDTYRAAAAEVARETGIDCIDMGAVTRELLAEAEAQAKDISKLLYLHIQPQDKRYINDPDYLNSKFYTGTPINVNSGKPEDDTHTCAYGARIYAMELARQLAQTESAKNIWAYVNQSKLMTREDLLTDMVARYNDYNFNGE